MIVPESGSKSKLSIVIPVYYNEGSLPFVFKELQRIESLLAGRGLAMELIFVDDGSGDNSLQRLLAIKGERPETKVVKLTRNFGAVHATKTGVQFVTGDAYVVLAADLQDPPELILEMVDRWLAGSKYVICARIRRGDQIATTLFASFYYKLVHMFVMKEYPDRGYDLALMDKAFLPYMRQSGKNVNPLIFSYWLGFKPEVIEYERQVRQHGKSRWTFSKRFKFFLDSILGFSIVPIRAMSLIGTIIATLSVAYGCWIAINAALGHMEVRGFATIVALITFMFGLVILMLGVIGEYLWRIFDEVTKRPESVIDEVY
jgi:polyisoprenyl-phosphate glycosyltransferase